MEQSPKTTVESARASIDRDIEVHFTAVAAHLAAVQALRQQRNRLLPISSLPPEIMCNIFSFVKSGSRLTSVRWTKVSHVCRYWRKVALNAAGLWCNLPLENLSWTVEMLARSKQVDISIDTVVDSRKLASLEKAFRHGARIRHISLIFHYYQDCEWVPGVLDNLPISAPHLETLSVDMGPEYKEENISIYEDTLVDVPNLRRLELTCCGANWDSHWFPQITHLKICDIPKPEELTWTRFMAALGNVHNLESLVLDYALPHDSASTSELDHLASINIHFSRLRVLSLEATALQVETFFRCATFSPDAAVHVRCSQHKEQRPRTDAAHFATILTNIARSYSNPVSAALPFKTLVVEPGYYIMSIHFALFNDVFGESAELFGDAEVPRCGLSLSFSTYRAPSVSWFSTVLPGLFSVGFALDNISHVHLGSDRPLEEGIQGLLVETVGLLPAVSFVKVSGFIGPCLVPVGLSHTDEDVEKPIPLLTPFASLKSMHFYRVPFLPSYTEPTMKLGRVDRELLQQFLVMRSATVRRIRLEKCSYLKKADVDELCKVVGDVVCWDGVEQGSQP
ncbi:hypothetical protein HYPSUDRAFT_44278 [Hypholoma sublateritium FD-334 SS-4]|uniref:F-box domain-containing protein n=1 Tax=Hypholoma sublateritium (strain FD-334 SS-4) TaxID=945553 RepID=A0A0D2PHG0_HYPSF|nr:hypothetical protein HYPSUDRAFT_44278 [Hypholoma sublateritium FD-334 SS-4]